VTVIWRPSPNFNERPVPVDMLIMHYTGMTSAEGAILALTDGEGPRRVSAHYTLDEDGTVYAHVAEEMRAWHAGVSWWQGRDDVNSRSVGIEIVNPGHEWGYRAFPKAQIDALIVLAKGIVARHGIPARNVVGHSDIAPGRKIDPGELFPWKRLAGHGIGVWPRRGRAAVQHDEASLAAALRTIGYGVPPEVDVALPVIVAEFQRHWRPSKVDGVADLETRQAMAGVIAALG
jgi:N-acetylmuramoyl-L-alanine amidase